MRVTARRLARCSSAFGHIDVAFNNAGVHFVKAVHRYDCRDGTG